MMRRAKLLGTDQRGAAAAEMALILPLALALLFTTFEGAYYMICEHQVIKGVRNAARYAARLDLSFFSCPGANFNDSNGKLAQIQNLARTGALSGGTAMVQGWVNSDVTVRVTCASGKEGIYVATGGNAAQVRVSTRLVYPSIMSSFGFTNATLDIGAEAQSPVIGL